MRKVQKMLLLELLDTLRDAHKAIREYASGKNVEQAKILLADCQNTAIQMGELIEQSEGEESGVVQLLERYCDILFQVYEDLSGDSFIYKTVDNALAQVAHSVQRISVRLEVVFFPYKASMWDSLESIWKAAASDPNCDAYIVPIPYYEKRPDGSLGKLHYEGKEYSPYLPVVDWRTYDVEKRHPDAAFIHNPYDDQNVLTQVPDQYFSSKLKKQVGLLCYVPYFVAAGALSPHFAYLPAVLNADFTIVESEQVRQQYLSVWHSLEKNEKALPGCLNVMKSRILALGSPKYDAIVGTIRNDAVLPDCWKRLIFRPDGTRKKVIFYNTSINAMLTGTMNEDGKITTQYLDKLEMVLSFFRHREDSVLLWRPHPLLDDSVASMRPQLYRRYVQILQDYRKSGYGIYDDSVDLHRAINAADAYYGDGSSIVALWEKTGKPLLLANCNVLTDEQRLGLASLYFDGKSLWCTALDFNALFQIELDTWRLHYIGAFPGEEREGRSLFMGICEYHEKLYFSPYAAKHIGVYDKNSGAFSSIPLESQQEREVECGGYCNAFVWKDCVFMTGGTMPSILRLDTQTNQVGWVDDWGKKLNSRFGSCSFQNPVHGCQVREKLYLPCGGTGMLFVFDMNSGNSALYSVAELGNEYDGCISVDSQIWVYSSVGASVKIFDPERERVLEPAISLPLESFSTLTARGDTVMGALLHQNQILKIDLRNEQIRSFSIPGKAALIADADCRIYTTLYRSGQLCMIDLESEHVSTAKLRCPDGMPDIDISKVYESSKRSFGWAVETEFLNLGAWIELVQETVPIYKAAQSCGEEIYQQVKKFLH